MSEFEGYIARIRAELDLNAKRADEICAEVRSHLETRAAQLEEEGLSRKDAVSQAVDLFGDARRVARELARANRGYAARSLLRAGGALAVAWASALAVVALTNIPGLRTSLAVVWLPASAGPGWIDAGVLVLVVLAAAPGAVLAGIVGGRRYWLATTTPAVFWLLLCWGYSLVHWQLVPYVHIGEQLLYALVWPLMSAAVWGAGGWLGARVRGVGWAGRIVAVVCGGYGAGLAICARRPLLGISEVWMAVAIGEAVLLALLFATYREERIRRSLVLTAGSAVCGMALVSAAVMVVGTSGMNVWSSFAAAAAGVVTVVGMVALALIAFRHLGPGKKTEGAASVL